jgi:hypothetical protein
MSSALSFIQSLTDLLGTSACIDKRSSAELSEAINSMFHWYRTAQICYAYLVDVPDDVDMSASRSAFTRSRWWTRGWCLQELLAPGEVEFYSQGWKNLGGKISLCYLLSKITSISRDILLTGNLHHASVAQKMSWAAKRETTRIEDTAYCLLGIFDVNMPLLYGEREKAFVRLQLEIAKTYDDQSLFAWRSNGRRYENHSAMLRDRPDQPLYEADTPHHQAKLGGLRGLLATSPMDFAFSGGVSVAEHWPGIYGSQSLVARDKGFQIELPLIDPVGRILDWKDKKSATIKDLFVIPLACQGFRHTEEVLALLVLPWNSRFFGRYGDPVLVPASSLEQRDMQSCMRILNIKAEPPLPDFRCDDKDILFKFDALQNTTSERHWIVKLCLFGQATFEPTSSILCPGGRFGIDRGDLANQKGGWATFLRFHEPQAAILFYQRRQSEVKAFTVLVYTRDGNRKANVRLLARRQDDHNNPEKKKEDHDPDQQDDNPDDQYHKPDEDFFWPLAYSPAIRAITESEELQAFTNAYELCTMDTSANAGYLAIYQHDDRIPLHFLCSTKSPSRKQMTYHEIHVLHSGKYYEDWRARKRASRYIEPVTTPLTTP